MIVLKLLLFIALISIKNLFAGDDMLQEVLRQIENQTVKKYQIFSGRFPETTKDGKWIFREKVNWLSGFLGGELWLLYEMTGQERLRELAIEHSDDLMQYSGIDYTHDMGFIFLPSCVKSYQITGDAKYSDVAIQAAEMLAKRFNNYGKFIRAWGKLGSQGKSGWMIIDTMMNLELLFWAAQETGKRELYNIAYQHATTTLQKSIRENGSSFHVVEFDPETGSVLKKRTHQGYSDESTWARGQTWGLYGFAKAYLYSGDKEFLQASKMMADYYLKHLPEDLIPTWDLDLKDQTGQKDASAAAIAASGLYLLSEIVESRKDCHKYEDAANKIIQTLIENHLFTKNQHMTEEGVLLNTVYNYHKKWGIDESFPAGDYYFTEALSKYWRRQNEIHQIKDKNQRQVLNINKKWYYLEDNIKDIKDLNKSSNIWQKVDLPHTWNQWDATDNLPGYRRDASWYQKELFIPDVENSLNFILNFEGANVNSEIYVNGQRAGGHVGGYVGFEVDITDYLNYGKPNTISVRVDNSYNLDIIPSQMSDFFIYGGLTRDVWLLVVPEIHITKIHIKTPSVSAEEATTLLEVRLSDKIKSAQNYFLEARLIDIDGEAVLQKKEKVSAQLVTIKFPSFKNPNLWSPESPYLYTAQVSLKKEDKVLDQVSEKCGYRWFEFKEHGPFYLNGKRLLLRGSHRHEEHAGYGAAMPNEFHRQDMEMIKEMGANFVRLAHYPQDPEIYRACDELGLLVWDELPWCRGGLGNSAWKRHTKRLLKEMIDQNFNHPSIIIWSMGNEVYWLPERPDGDNIDSLRFFLKELNDFAHQLDPGRITAIRKFYEGADIVDVFSPSIWAGWYSGVYTNYEKAITDARDKYKRFFHAEYGGSSHVGRHVENPISGEGVISTEGWEETVNQVKVKNIARYGDWSESYMVDLFDWHLHLSENLDWFTGNAQWAFKDFGTPLRPENPIPFVNQKGLVDRSGQPKDAYYVFKSYWTRDPKFCYIESQSWTHRSGPPGKSREISVFSNCDEVELFLNGRNLGKRKKEITKFSAQGLTWEILFEEGSNVLIANGYVGEKRACADTLTVFYSFNRTGKPEKFQLTSHLLPNGNLLITATLVDKNGQRCLDYNKRIYFSSDGDGYLIQNYGTPTRSPVIEMANGRAAIEFKHFPGKRAVIEARNQDFKGNYLVIE